MTRERKAGQLVEFPYEKYGEHTIAIVTDNGLNLELFDATTLFQQTNTRAEYERVKEQAADWAKDFVRTYNVGLKALQEPDNKAICNEMVYTIGKIIETLRDTKRYNFTNDYIDHQLKDAEETLTKYNPLKGEHNEQI